jgi:hypothetical protein
MKRAAIKIGFVMELIVAAAVGFAVVRSHVSGGPWVGYFGTPARADWVRLVGGSFLTGLALAGAGGLAVEAFRGRRPSSWGLGRWIWSIAGFFMIFNAADLIAETAVLYFGPASRSFNWRAMVGSLPERWAIHQFYASFGWSIAAVCATAMLAGAPRDPEPDAREWAGRLFASLAVAVNIAESLLRLSSR